MLTRVIDGIRSEILRGLSAHHLALAVACGTVCAFFPLLGLATPLCILVGIVFRLNHPVIQAVNAVTAPAYPFVAYGLFALGERIGGSASHGSGFAALSSLFNALKAGPVSAPALKAAAWLLVDAVAGWAVFAALAVPLLYWISRAVIAWFNQRRRSFRIERTTS